MHGTAPFEDVNRAMVLHGSLGCLGTITVGLIVLICLVGKDKPIEGLSTGMGAVLGRINT